MDEILHSTLRTAVFERLTYLDTLVDTADDESKSKLADTVITQLTGAWRELLDAHEPDERGRCRGCSPGRLRSRAGCLVWLTAHRNLITDTAERPATGRHHLLRPRPATT
ncbi:MAG TPA: hypothetical protein VGL46_15195 [Pseudonocardiaceae bacterium]